MRWHGVAEPGSGDRWVYPLSRYLLSLLYASHSCRYGGHRINTISIVLALMEPTTHISFKDLFLSMIRLTLTPQPNSAS